ncbi:MAG: polyphosphate polymerase domain-containing protein [Lachnospiraceae bacterium]|nr:polyphosphate polymerase domain-containing protein [Lachnospiraceae bacterium]
MAEVKDPIVVMKRYELKYMVSPAQQEYLLKSIAGHMKVDQFGLTSIASLYYDTPDYRLIRTSIEKPEYKEKIRLRSYGLATDDSKVFLELKRKMSGIVYKRRVASTIPLVKRFFDGEGDICAGGQINSELVTFRDHYKTLVPACLIIYDREAYFEPGGDLRLTLDRNPRYRSNDLTLTKDMEGISLLPEGYAILEIKVQDAMPLWLARILSEGKIYKTSFSKVGEAYKRQWQTLERGFGNV